MVWIFLGHSPVACLNPIRVLYFVAFNMESRLFQLDVKNAFLYGDLEEVYMEQPAEYIDLGEDVVCRFRKRIYGLKYCPKLWFEKLNLKIFGIGFARQSDHSVFVHRIKFGLVILAVYINDILLTGSDFLLSQKQSSISSVIL